MNDSISASRQDLRPLDSLTEEEFNEVLEREIPTMQQADMRLKGNVDYIAKLLTEVLRRRRAEMEPKG